MDNPLVSVVLATYNEPQEFIAASINSVVKQTYSNWELIIVDDSTNEYSIQIINDFAQNDNRIKIIRQEERMGFVKALNIGLKFSHGKYIARMDGDDVASPDRFEKEVDFLQKHQDVDVIGGAMNIINENGTIVAERNYPLGGYKLHLWSVFRNPLAHPTVMFRNSIVQNGFLYNEKQKKAEDIEFWLRLKKNKYKIQNLPDKILNYRVVGNIALKRNREQWIYNFKARKSNFCWRYPIFIILSVGISFLFILIPNKIVEAVYRRENNSNR